MAQSMTITDKIKSITTMNEDDKDSEVLWMTQVIDMIKKLKDNPSTDCSIIVGETRIPVHKAVVQLNSSMLTSRSVGYDEHNEVTEIEVDLEFDDQPELINKIVTSFYTGTIALNEEVMREAYKFSAIYDIGWLKVHTRRMIVNYMFKSVDGCYERFTEVFSIANYIWDTDLFESCIQVIDADILELLIEDTEMLGKITYNCMEIITVSSNVGFPEKDLFDLLVAWVICKSQNKNLQTLFGNIRYELIDKDFIIERVMTYVSQNEEIFTVSFLTKIQDGMVDSSKDMCRSDRRREIAVKRVQIVIDMCRSLPKNKKSFFAKSLLAKSPYKIKILKKKEEAVNEVNSFMIRKDIRYLPDEKKEELSSTIWNSSLVSSLDWLSVANLINTHQTSTTAYILGHIFDKQDIALSDYYKVDWTKVTDKAVICVMKTMCNENYIDVQTAMSWCLANRDTCDDATLETVISEICYKKYEDVYNSNILLPTIKYLLPNTTELKCQHSDECGKDPEKFNFEIKTVNEKLYKLEPFEDCVATLSDNNGVLELWPNNGVFDLWIMCIKDKPYEPFYPVLCEREVDDETLRRFVAAVKDGNEIIILESNIRFKSCENSLDNWFNFNLLKKSK